MENILEVIREKYPKLSPKGKQLGDYILQNYKTAAVMNISALAEAAGTSVSSVVRFANDLGCSGFPMMQQELQKVMFNYYSSLDEIEEMKSTDSRKQYLNQVQRSLEQLPQMYAKRDEAIIAKAADMLYEAEHVFLVGNQISAPFCPYTQYLLGKYKPGIQDVSEMTMEDEDELRAKSNKSVAIVFALQRYPNKTLHAIRQLHACGIPMIVFTDSELFPLRELAACMICIPTTHWLAFSPMMLLYSIMYELILLVIDKDVDKAMENVQRFDEYVERNQIYYGSRRHSALRVSESEMPVGEIEPSLLEEET